MLQITPEERATLQLLADGKRTSEIAVRLRVPECQIDEQVTTLFAKLGVTSRTEAVAAAAKRGLVVVDPTLIDAGSPLSVVVIPVDDRLAAR